MTFYCWHRAGKRWRGHIYLCQHCGIAIEECPCVNWGRSPDSKCPCCEGSGWVAVLQSKMQILRDFVFGGYLRNADGWDDPDR